MHQADQLAVALRVQRLEHCIHCLLALHSELGLDGRCDWTEYQLSRQVVEQGGLPLRQDVHVAHIAEQAGPPDQLLLQMPGLGGSNSSENTRIVLRSRRTATRVLWMTFSPARSWFSESMITVHCSERYSPTTSRAVAGLLFMLR